MRVIVIASQKGGVGKTTVAGHLAVEAEARGAGPVALIDTDPQGSLAAWWNARAAETPLFAHAGIKELSGHLAALRSGGIQLVIVDTPPAITSAISAVVKYADLVIIPSRPSPHDLRAVGATVDLVDAEHKQMIFVLNGATARTRISSDAAIALSQHGTVAPITLHHRTDFASAMTDGRVAGEIDHTSNSAKEVAELWAYVNARLGKSVSARPRSPVTA